MSVMCILTPSGTKLLLSEAHGFATKNDKCKKVNKYMGHINCRGFTLGYHILLLSSRRNKTCLFFLPIFFFLSSSVCCQSFFKIQRATFYISIKLRAVGIDQSADRFFSNNTPYMSSKALSVVEFSFTAGKIAELAALQLGRKSRRLCFPGKTCLLRVNSPKSFGLTK